jgi:class 3 adenylate cyclase
MTARRWRSVLWPDFPEPVDLATYRRAERLLWVMLPVLAALNLATRTAMLHEHANIVAYDRFLSINLPAHATALALNVAVGIGTRSVETHRRAAFATFVVILFTSLPGLWLLGSVTPSVNTAFFILTIAAARVFYDARIGLWTLGWALAQHALLVALEVNGVVPHQALFPDELKEALYARNNMVVSQFVWIGAVYVVVWVLSSYVAHRFRASEHALRELNVQLEERVETQVTALARAQRLRRYVAPQLADQILRSEIDPVDVRERRPITVMFADLRGFTSMVERLPPETLATVLNRWFDEVAQIAFSFGGTVDKFIGDAVMVFFGAPEAVGEREQALRCVRMALAIVRRAEELGDEIVALGAGAPLQVRIGIASGQATVGSFGAAHRADYTVVGASVNRAARLEPLAPPGGVLVDEETNALIAGEFVVESAGEVALKGFAMPVRTYRVACEARAS